MKMLAEFSSSKQSLLKLARNNPSEALTLLQEEKKLRKFIAELNEDHKFPQVTINRTRITGLNKSDTQGMNVKGKPVFIYNKELRPFLISENALPSVGDKTIPLEIFPIITPSIALKIMLNNNMRNRKINWGRIRIYSKCMKDGQWFPTHQGIAFYKNGIFADGQHRLLSIILSGVSVPMRLSFGLDKKCCLYVDEGRSRSVTDQVKVMGEDKNITDRGIKTANWMLEGITKKGKKHASAFYRKEIVDFYHKHEESIIYACNIDGEISQNKSNYIGVLNIAPLRAVLARMYYSTMVYNEFNNNDSMSRLHELKRVLLTGASSHPNQDRGALKIASLRTTKPGRKVFSGNQQTDGYYKAEKCFDSFMKRENVKKITAAKYELFLLPDEAQIIAYRKARKKGKIEATTKM